MNNVTGLGTFAALLLEHGSVVIPLDEIAPKYLGLTRKQALELYRAGELPFRAFQDAGSRKRPVLVHLADLAEYVDGFRA